MRDICVYNADGELASFTEAEWRQLRKDEALGKAVRAFRPGSTLRLKSDDIWFFHEDQGRFNVKRTPEEALGI